MRPCFLAFFFCFKVEYCPRACNSVVDDIAAFGAKLRDEPQTIWLGHAPEFVRVHVASDIAVPLSNGMPFH